MASRGIAVATLILFFTIATWSATLPGAGAAERTRVLDDPPGQDFAHPCDIDADGQGVLFILDSGRQSVFIFSADGRYIRTINGRGSWKDPQGIALMPDRTVLLADGDAGRVIELDLSGTVRREYSLGKGSRATDAAFYGNLVYCVDNRNGKIVVFRRSGERAGGWGKKGEAASDFSSPFRIAIDPSGRVFVTDVMNSRVQWFSPHGQLLGTIRDFGVGRGKLLRPSAVAVDGMGGVWIGDSYSGIVQQFDDKGNVVKVLASGKGTPELHGDPSGIAKVPGGVWVADQRGKRVTFVRQ